MNGFGMIPDSSNFFVSLDTTLSRSQVSEVFREPIWQTRKCSWTDYEVISEFAELIIEAESPILLHGPVADQSSVDQILELLRVAGISYSGEYYPGQAASVT